MLATIVYALQCLIGKVDNNNNNTIPRALADQRVCMHLQLSLVSRIFYLTLLLTKIIAKIKDRFHSYVID